MAGTNLMALEKAKICYLKRAGNLIDMAQDLGVEVSRAKELVDEFKKQESEDVKVLISNHLMRLVIFGSEGRKLRFMEMIKSLEATEKPRLSVCCNSRFSIINSGQSEPEIYRCLKCNATCAVHKVPKATIYNIKINIEEQLRKEDETLVNMAEKMGYTNKPEGPSTLTQVKQDILIIGGEGKDKQIIDDYSKLTPMDREILMEKLRKEIVTIDEDIKTAETEEAQSSNPLP